MPLSVERYESDGRWTTVEELSDWWLHANRPAHLPDGELLQVRDYDGNVFGQWGVLDGRYRVLPLMHSDGDIRWWNALHSAELVGCWSDDCDDRTLEAYWPNRWTQSNDSSWMLCVLKGLTRDARLHAALVARVQSYAADAQADAVRREVPIRELVIRMALLSAPRVPHRIASVMKDPARDAAVLSDLRIANQSLPDGNRVILAAREDATRGSLFAR